MTGGRNMRKVNLKARRSDDVVLNANTKNKKQPLIDILTEEQKLKHNTQDKYSKENLLFVKRNHNWKRGIRVYVN